MIFPTSPGGGSRFLSSRRPSCGISPRCWSSNRGTSQTGSASKAPLPLPAAEAAVPSRRVGAGCTAGRRRSKRPGRVSSEGGGGDSGSPEPHLGLRGGEEEGGAVTPGMPSPSAGRSRGGRTGTRRGTGVSERRGAWRWARAELARDADRGGAPGEDDEDGDGDANAAPGTERALRWL